VIDEHLAHRPGRHGEKVLAVLPLDTAVVDELEVRLVDQLGRLERVVVRLLPTPVVSDALQFVVHGGQQVIDHLVSLAETPKETGNV
jgi:hypothetical protein